MCVDGSNVGRGDSDVGGQGEGQGVALVRNDGGAAEAISVGHEQGVVEMDAVPRDNPVPEESA